LKHTKQESSETSALWRFVPTLEGLNNLNKSTLCESLAIEFTEIGDDFLRATMPVDSRTVQPAGRLHGGASAALIETLGSVASYVCIDAPKEAAVGIELNCSHLRGASEGMVTGTVRPVRIGRTLHVWSAEITDELGRLLCVGRLTVSIIPGAQ